MPFRALLLAGMILVAPSGALADAVADFYNGKKLQFIIRANPGGNYDLYLRLLARHMVRYIPGNPTAVPVNMPGGGGRTALNFFDKVAPHDGTTITMVTQTVPMDQALRFDPNLKTDMRKLNWLGNMSDENMFLVLMRSAATKSLDDARRRDTVLASTGTGGSEVFLISIINHVLGTRFKNVHGYRSSPEMNLAMQRGEVEGRIMTNLRLASKFFPKGIADLNPVLQTGLKKDKSYPNVPLLLDQGRDESGKLMVGFISKVMGLARPVATNENVPRDRVAALRRAFDAAMKDPALLAEAGQQGLHISAWTGEELQSTVIGIVNTPESTLEQIRKVIKGAASSQPRRK
jgi:tripartite-type tricarboxylate transporter receptor subunit TctC